MRKICIALILLSTIISCNSSKKDSSSLDIVKAMYAHNAAGENDEFIALLADDILWIEAEDYIYADRNPYQGKQEVIEGIFVRTGEEWEDFRLDDLIFYDMKDNMVLVSGRYRGTNRVTGKELNAQMAHHWTIKDGKAIKFQQYVNTKHVFDATQE